MSHRPRQPVHSSRGARRGDRRDRVHEGPRRIVRAPSIASGAFVMGRRCLNEVLRHAPERIRDVWMVAPRADQDSEFRELVSALERTGRPMNVVDRTFLTELVQSDSHQGVVARVSDRRHVSLNDWIDGLEEGGERLSVIAIDAVQDPMNFGAILRIAECFGVSAVMWSKNRSVPLTPVVSKASAGASELVRLMPVSNLQEALERLKRAGFWIVAADISPGATALPEFDFPERTVLVMGSEGRGIQPLIMKSVDFRVTIPMRGRLDSLNVSQATAVIASAWCTQALRAAKKV